MNPSRNVAPVVEGYVANVRPLYETTDAGAYNDHGTPRVYTPKPWAFAYTWVQQHFVGVERTRDNTDKGARFGLGLQPYNHGYDLAMRALQTFDFPLAGVEQSGAIKYRRNSGRVARSFQDPAAFARDTLPTHGIVKGYRSRRSTTLRTAANVAAGKSGIKGGNSG